MEILKDIGFRKKWIYETIVITQNGKHAAPMGVWAEDFTSLSMDVYKGSQTLANILKDGKFTLGITDDVKIFYKTLKDGHIAVGDLSATLELVVDNTKDTEDEVRVIASVKSYSIKDKPKLMNRAEALALECLIKSTKPGTTNENLQEYLRVVKKVAPGSEYERIVSELMQ